MNAGDCKPVGTDVVAPRVPMVVASFAVALALYALFKVLELEQRIGRQRD